MKIYKSIHLMSAIAGLLMSSAVGAGEATQQHAGRVSADTIYRLEAWDISAAVQNAGMEYHHVPLVLSREGIDAASAARISELVQALAGETVLIHCASGNRVAVWWALHLAAEHGMKVDDVIQLAELAGMNTALAPLVEANLRQ